MSLAFSILGRLHHRVRFALSPSYRQVRRRLDEIGRPPD